MTVEVNSFPLMGCQQRDVFQASMLLTLPVIVVYCNFLKCTFSFCICKLYVQSINVLSNGRQLHNHLFPHNTVFHQCDFFLLSYSDLFGLFAYFEIVSCTIDCVDLVIITPSCYFCPSMHPS
jgi:hypothetical protein